MTLDARLALQAVLCACVAVVCGGVAAFVALL